MANQKLVDFIKESKKVGQTEEQIKSALRQAGWQDTDIGEALKFDTDTTAIATNANITATTTKRNPTNAIYQSSEPVVITEEKKHSGKNIFVLALILFLLAGGALGYYYRNDLKTLPIIRDFFPIQVKEVAVSQEKSVQKNSVTIPSSTTTQLTVAVQLPQKQNCGSVNNLHVLVNPKDITDQEKQSMLCISQALENCEPAMFELLGKKGGGVGSGGDFEIKNNDDIFCKVYGHSDEPSRSFKQTCKVPISLVADMAKTATDENKKGYLFIGMAMMIFPGGGKITNTRTGEKIQVECQ